jgi:hypothetical protein
MPNPRNFRLLAMALAAGAVPAIVDPGAIGSASELHELAIGPTPYFIPAEAWLLYVRAPIVAISAFLLFLSPGLIAALALSGSDRFERWLLNGFGVSLASISLSAAFVQELLGDAPLRGGAFAALVLVLLGSAFAVIEIRLRQGRFVASPLGGRESKRTLLGLAAAVWLLLAALVPKIYWENFNDDGVQAFEAMRLLLVRPLPFWEPEAGIMAQFPGFTTMLFAFPGAWFLRLFGEVEAAARLPFLLYLVVLYAGVVAGAEEGRERLRSADRALFVLPLIAYALVMAYSATYDPYSADMALPATSDTLGAIAFLGAVVAFLRSERVLLCFWSGLAFFAQPSAILLLVLWAAAAALFQRPRPLRQVLAIGGTLAGCVMLSASASWWTAVVGVPTPGSEHSAGSLLSRINDFQLAEWLLLQPLRRPEYWQRWLFLLIPCGIVPAVALFDWKRLDRAARTLAAAALAYFALFYLQAQTSLHYFAPVMVLPLVVLGRSRWLTDPALRRIVVPLMAVGGAIGVFLSLPATARSVLAARTVGSALEVRLEGYERMNPALFKELELLSDVIPRGYTPEIHYGGSPYAWNYYAQKRKTKETINYVIQAAQAPPPDGMTLKARDSHAAVYVADDGVLSSHLAMRPATPAGARLYALPRETMFVQEGIPIEQVVEDVARRLGLHIR